MNKNILALVLVVGVIALLAYMINNKPASNNNLSVSDSATYKSLDYKIVEVDQQEKAPGHSYVSWSIVITSPAEEVTHANVMQTLIRSLEKLRGEHQPDAADIFVYKEGDDLKNGYTVGKVSWWPEGHDLGLNNSENIQNKDAYTTDYDIVESALSGI